MTFFGIVTVISSPLPRSRVNMAPSQSHKIKERETVEKLKAGAAAVAVAIVLSLAASGTPARADSRADIRALEDRFVAAFKAKDVDAIMKVYAPGQALVVFDVIPPRQYVGAAAYRKDWQTFLDNFDGPITVELTDLDVGADRNLAYSHSISARVRHRQAGEEARPHRAGDRRLSKDRGPLAYRPRACVGAR
jgi:ketosteroid isomerase-like protein